MKRILLSIILGSASFTLAAATLVPIMENTNGALTGGDTNFFVVNSNKLNAAVAAHGGGQNFGVNFTTNGSSQVVLAPNVSVTSMTLDAPTGNAVLNMIAEGPGSTNHIFLNPSGFIHDADVLTTGQFRGNGAGLTNIAFAAVTSLGTAAHSNATAFQRSATGLDSFTNTAAVGADGNGYTYFKSAAGLQITPSDSDGGYTFWNNLPTDEAAIGFTVPNSNYWNFEGPVTLENSNLTINGGSITIYGQNDFEGISSYPYGVGNRDLIASFGTNYQSHAGRYVTQINGGDGRLVTAMIPEIFATYHTSQNASLYDCHIIATPTNGDMNIILPRLTNSYLGEAWQLPPSQAIFTSNTLKFSIYHFGTNSANAVHVFTTNHDVIWCGPAATTNLSVPYGSAVRLITDGVTIWGEGGGEYLTAGPSGPRDGSLLTGVAAALPAFALTNADANNRSLAGNLQVTTLSSSNAGAGTGWSVVTGPNSGAAIETGGSANTNVHRFNAEAGQTLGTIFSWSSNDTSLGNMDLSGNFSTAGAVTGKGLINNGPATLNYAFTPGPSGVGGFFSQTNYELNVASYTSYSYVVSNILGAATNWIVSTNGTAAGTTNTWYYGYTAFWECKTNLANCGSRILNGGRFGYNLNGANTSVGVDSGANGGPAGGVSIGGSVTTVGNAVTVTGSGTNLVNFIAKVSVLAW